MIDTLDYLPLSYLNQLAYCERRFWLMFVEGELAINAPMLDGIYRHERTHQPGHEQRGELTSQRQVYVWSDRLRLVGLVDCVEDEAGRLQPIEHKRGKMSRWLNDHLQLCAQALCLEERSGQTIDQGYLFYWGNRRRETVQFDAALRARTEAAVARALVLLEQGQRPPPLQPRAKCKDCSMEPICQPREVKQLSQRSNV